MGEKTDPQTLIRDLNAALPLQYRSTLALAIAAGTIPGPAGVALAPELRRFAEHSLTDVERIAARITSLGGVPASDVAPLDTSSDWRESLQAIVAFEYDALEALVEAIPAKAADPEGEATEHLLEHIVSHKRDAVELLERALR